MNELSSGRSKSLNGYTRGSDPSSSHQWETGTDGEGPWKNLGTSMNAISLGFVATAILISMFLIMAIFEHLFRPDPTDRIIHTRSGSSPPEKPSARPTAVAVTCAADFSVVMPGEQFPTFIAQPAPLPCPREPICRQTYKTPPFSFPS